MAVPETIVFTFQSCVCLVCQLALHPLVSFLLEIPALHLEEALEVVLEVALVVPQSFYWTDGAVCRESLESPACRARVRH